MDAAKLEWKPEDVSSTPGTPKITGTAIHHSPLFHIRSTLKFLRLLLGFPVVPITLRWDTFVFMPIREYAKLLMILILFITPNVALMGSFGKNFDALKKMYNISSLDFIVEVSALLLIPFGFNLVYFINFKNHSKNLNKICKLMSDINYRQAHYHNCIKIHVKAKNRVFNCLMIYFLMGMVIAGLFATANYVAFVYNDSGVLNGNIKVILSGLMPITVLLGPLSPMVSSGDLVVNYLIRHLSENIRCLRTSLKIQKEKHNNRLSFFKTTATKSNPDGEKETKKEEKMPVQDKHMQVMVDLALDICKVIKKVNKTFSGILFFAYAGNLLIATTAFYTFAKSLFIIKFSSITFCWGILHLVSFVLYMARLYESTTSGHNLGKNMYLLRLAFKKYNATNNCFKAHVNTRNNGIELYHENLDLVYDLLDNSSPISPYGYFGMTRGSFLSALATIATYLIVLIQFKTSEK